MTYRTQSTPNRNQLCSPSTHSGLRFQGPLGMVSRSLRTNVALEQFFRRIQGLGPSRCGPSDIHPSPVSLYLRDYLPLCALVQHEACGGCDLQLGGCQLPNELPQPPPHHPGSPGECAEGRWGVGGLGTYMAVPRNQSHLTLVHAMILGPHIIENYARYSTGH